MILIITQCCFRKRAVELFPEISRSVLDIISEDNVRALIRGRELLKDCIYGSRDVTALSLYDGFEYKALNKWLIKRAILNSEVDLIIVSAGYGLVHAFERVRAYNAVMKGDVLRLWLSVGLPGVIADYAIRSSAEVVYGFFTKSSGYVEIFRRVARRMRTAGLDVKLVSPVVCRGTSRVLTALGLGINELVRGGSVPEEVGGCRLEVSGL